MVDRNRFSENMVSMFSSTCPNLKCEVNITSGSDSSTIF